MEYLDFNSKNGELYFRLQTGPIKEVGVNGAQIDDLIQFCKNKLEEFQKLAPSGYTLAAMLSLDAALIALALRTSDRTKRGVEGTHES